MEGANATAPCATDLLGLLSAAARCPAGTEFEPFSYQARGLLIVLLIASRILIALLIALIAS